MQKLATTLHWCLPHLQEKSRNSRTWIMQKLAATLVPSLIFKRRHVFHMYYAKTGNNIFNRAMTESQVSSQAHKVSFTVKPWTWWFVYFLRPLNRQFVLNIHSSSITCFGSFIKIFWPIELNDLLSKTICDLRWLFDPVLLSSLDDLVCLPSKQKWWIKSDLPLFSFKGDAPNEPTFKEREISIFYKFCSHG